MLLRPGTMFVSEHASWLYVHELVLEPRLALKHFTCILSPEAEEEAEVARSLISACWAPDDSAVLLQYNIWDDPDGYTESDWNDVRPWQARARSCMLCAVFCKLLITLLLQVLYMLDVGDEEPAFVTESEQYRRMGNVSFSLDSTLILVSWEGLDDSDPANFDVHDRAGHRLAQFQVPGMPPDQGPPAHTLGGRAAFVRSHDFSVVELCTGDLLGVRGPGVSALDDNPEHAGLVTANSAGSKLAFCARGSGEIHLYDALTLAALGSVSPFGAVSLSDLADAGPAELRSLQFCGRGWSVCAKAFGKTMLFFQAQQGSGDVKQTMRCECSATVDSSSMIGGWLHDAPDPVVSPNAAFVCTYEGPHNNVSVYDTRSGQQIFTHPFVLPEGMPAAAAKVKQVAMSWSSCERHLLVTATVQRFSALVDQLLVVQF